MFLVDQPFLEKLERLTLHWQKSFRGLVGGQRASRFPGPGQEFLDHRNFYPGDDTRMVNWRVYMRFERFFLKTFHVEPRVPVRLLLDTSASMAAKFDYARQLAAALVYIGMVRLDAIAIQPFSSGLGQPHTASGGRHQFQRAEAFLRGLSAAGESNFLRSAREFLHRYTQPGFTIVISDFLNADCVNAMQYLADYRHELLLAQVWNPEDREPAGSGPVEFIDSESHAHLVVQLDGASIRAHAAAFDEHASQVRRVAERNSGRYAAVPSDAALEDVLFGSLAK